jgi:hypothetical protein
MTTIATAQTTSKAPPSALFDRWADMATWPEWNHDVEWVRLDGPFAEGSTGVLKPKGGPKVKFVIERLVQDREFIDVSKLFGARLTFAHYTDPKPEGGTTVDLEITMTGPLAWLWTRILGKDLKASAQTDLESLAAAAEAA